MPEGNADAAYDRHKVSHAPDAHPAGRPAPERAYATLAERRQTFPVSPSLRPSVNAYVRGIDAETAACLALARHGWTILARRLRTEAGEIDIIAARPDLLAIIEVKARRTLSDAAFALSDRQRARLIGAADIALAEHPEWAREGMRFDLMVVDARGAVRRIADAFRLEN
jgi:putative endonuclease